MSEVFRALRKLKFDWKTLSPYNVQGRWSYDDTTGSSTGSIVHEDVDGEMNSVVESNFFILKIGLRLYKVQESIYLLDFQKISGDNFYFLQQCAKIIILLQQGLGGRRLAESMRASMSAPDKALAALKTY
jgi:5'-AMP-activated protein kinase catalytic alpha subunit